MKKAIKASKNACCKARLEADMERVAVSAATGIEVNRLAKIELDTKIPYPEEIVLLTNLYKAPELENWYCSKVCPIGKKCLKELEDVEFSKFERNIVRLSWVAKQMPTLLDSLVEIAEDGKVDYGEKITLSTDILEKIKDFSDKLSQMALWIEKNTWKIFDE